MLRSVTVRVLRFWRFSLHTFFLLFLVFQFSIFFCGARTSPNLKVRLEHGGVLVGRHLTAHSGQPMRAFLGVPYAKPPVGELRFRSPVPFGAWTGERQAISDSSKCTQRDPYRRDLEIEGSEDCLYINVYTPEVPATKNPLPVMVWFHGGGWQCGSGISSFYGPDFLMEHDIILISANFRLGPLGFLSTETIECPGNFGLKDQLEVLKWIQENIAAFGGDKNSVTIFGESAGGASVTYHMLSEKSKGLFHKGIIQSGTYFNPWAQPAHKGVPARRAQKLAKLVNCNADQDWTSILQCLRQRKAEDIVATIYDLFEWDYDPMIPFPPVIEPNHKDAFLTVSPRSKQIPHGFSLPAMIGATSEEGLLKTAALLNEPGLLDDFKTKFNKVLPIVLNYDHHSDEIQKYITERIKSFYFKNGHDYNKYNYQNITDLISDGWFIGGIDEYMRIRMNSLTTGNSNVGPTYVYLFDHKGAASFSELFKGGREDYYGACHAEELQYLFPIGRELFISASPTPFDLEIRNAMTNMWVNFAKTSNPTPNESNITNWDIANKYPVNFIRIGGKDEKHWTLTTKEEGLLQDRSDFWYQLKAHWAADLSKKDEL
ncbi:venom carboxylesterase-6 [Teleopsis dalmanni]|uniref:venom carboxylesterase-6 n=1 Tax=Teleopsis dalmanni TaxID=139649 RepID=UPI0018CF3C59|nr:venom carboxylesterase-6 [Teleopsis dalmanni]